MSDLREKARTSPSLARRIDELEADVQLLERVLHCFWQHVPDRGAAVRDMTTQEKERYADAVEAESKRLNAGSTCGCGCRNGATVDRWWREDFNA